MVEIVSMKNVSICPFFSFPVLLLKILILFFLLIFKNRTHLFFIEDSRIISLLWWCSKNFTMLYLHVGEGNGNSLQYSCLENPMGGGAWWAAVHGVAKSRTRLSDLTFTFHFHALEKEMATHSSVLAWRIPGTGEPGGLPSMGSHRVGHDWSDLAAAAAYLHVDLYIHCWSYSLCLLSGRCHPLWRKFLLIVLW